MNSDQIVVVDQQDQVLGLKRPAECCHDDIYRVTALWVTNAAGEVLLAQRKHSKLLYPGKWGPAVSGTLEPGESYRANIYREAEEEIGLTGLRFQLGPKRLVDDGQRRYFCQWYTAQLDREIADFAVQQDEVEKIAWITREELAKKITQQPADYIPQFTSWFELLSPSVKHHPVT